MPRHHSDNRTDVRKQVRAFLPGLTGKRASTRITAIRNIGFLGVGAAYVADKLLPFVEDSDEDIRSAAMHALSSIGVGSPSVSKSVRGLINKDDPDHDPYTNCRAYWILEHIEV